MKTDKPKYSLDEVQLVDGYVMGLLEHAVKTYGVKVDLENPTREQRLDAALAMQNEAKGVSSIEIMVGRRIRTDEDDKVFLITVQQMCPQDPRIFYEGFAHDYWPDSHKPSPYIDKKKQK